MRYGSKSGGAHEGSGVVGKILVIVFGSVLVVAAVVVGIYRRNPYSLFLAIFFSVVCISKIINYMNKKQRRREWIEDRDIRERIQKEDDRYFKNEYFRNIK